MTPEELLKIQAMIAATCSSGSSQLVPALAGIFGALVGAIASFIPNLIVESHRRRKEACLVEASLIAEMIALVEVAEERNYLSSLEQVISHLETMPAGSELIFRARIPAHYSRVYQANSHRIGIIEQTKAMDIIRFHQFVDSVVQDVSEGGVLSEGGAIDTFKENHQILSRAFAISRKYAGRT